MEEKKISISKTVRFYTLGEQNREVEHLWYLLHGYGQLAGYFIRPFREFESSKRLLVAPEGMHRFYLEGTEGRIGASWMTKEDRLQDIEDYCRYLNQLHAELLTGLNPDVKIHILGFSQGVATAFRWVNHFEGQITSLHGWAGTFPPDIDYALNRERFQKLRITAHFADNDRYIPLEKADELEFQLKSQGISLKRFDYKGEHKFYPEPLKDLILASEI